MNTTSSNDLPAQKKSVFLWKNLISLAILYHFLAILLAPNTDNFIALKLKPIFMPYWTALELGSEWNFFAPEPGPPPLFFEYEIFDRDGKRIAAEKMPEYPDHFFFRDRQIRRLNYIRYFMKNEQKIYTVFIPWLCNRFPNAESIRLKKIVYQLPSPLDIASGARALEDGLNANVSTLPEVSCDGRRTASNL